MLVPFLTLEIQTKLGTHCSSSVGLALPARLSSCEHINDASILAQTLPRQQDSHVLGRSVAISVHFYKNFSRLVCWKLISNSFNSRIEYLPRSYNSSGSDRTSLKKPLESLQSVDTIDDFTELQVLN